MQYSISTSNHQGRRYRFHFREKPIDDSSSIAFIDISAAVNFIRRFPNQAAIHAFTEKCINATPLKEKNALSVATNFQILLAKMIIEGVVNIYPQTILQPTVLVPAKRITERQQQEAEEETHA